VSVDSLAAGTDLAEQRALRARCAHPSGTFVPFPVSALTGSVGARFEWQVTQGPERLAIKTGSEAISYAALNASANRVAHALLDRGGAEPVGLLFGSDAAFITTSLGALKAGTVQVPLDRSFPISRLAYMLEQCGARLILTDTAQTPLARALAGPGMTVVDVAELHDRPTENPGVTVTPKTLAGIDYTSGSTGTPKGIVQDHHALLAVVMRKVNTFRVCSADRLSLIRPAIMTPLYALLAGATCAPLDPPEHSLEGVAEALIREEVTIWRAAVSALRGLVDSLRGGERFPSMRLVVVFGEPAYRSDVESYRRHFPPECVFVSTLGTRETGDYAYYFADHTSRLPEGAVPGGYQSETIDGVLLLDEDGRPVAEGEPGELGVRCRAVPVGYWDRPDLTEAALIPDPHGSDLRVYRTGDLGQRLPDGCFMHLGRRDFQMKIRGFRVNAGEVEAALLAVPGIKQAVAAARADTTGDTRLVAYLVGDGRALPGVSELRRILGQTLPAYMVPAAFVTLPELPYTPTGKIDRRALPAPGRARPDLGIERVAPGGPIEAALARMWADVLGLEEVGVRDGFLDLGGDSLLAAKVVSRVIERFNVELSTEALFAAPTVAEMAAVVLLAVAEHADQAAIERPLANPSEHAPDRSSGGIEV
jgi:amino acid adenylation domain-containing protein